MSPFPVLPSRLRRAFRVAAPLLTLLFGGCGREATSYSEYAPYKGAAPLTIRGVWPGQEAAAVISLLGAPDRRDSAGVGRETLQWQRFSDMAVTVDTSAGRVTEVLGNLLTAGSDPVIEPEMSEADVRQVLGKPVKDQSHSRPSGSGVISLGRTQTGRTLWYRRDGRTIEISVQKDRVAYLCLRLPPP